jgi:hypothetical protein
MEDHPQTERTSDGEYFKHLEKPQKYVPVARRTTFNIFETY